MMAYERMMAYEVTIVKTLIFEHDDLVSAPDIAIEEAEDWLYSLGVRPSDFEITVKTLRQTVDDGHGPHPFDPEHCNINCQPVEDQ